MEQVVCSGPVNSPSHTEDNLRWRPAASLANLRLRAAVLRQIRQFFDERGVLEVETPLLSHHASTEPHLHSLSTRFTGSGAPQGCTLQLQTSPEFAMKRLLAAGSGPIFQICKAFRDGEAGQRHNPEFTMLEWYCPGFDYHALMDEVAELLAMIFQTDAACQRISYAEVFHDHAGCDPHTAPVSDLRRCMQGATGDEIQGVNASDRDTWLDLIMSHVIEPQLGKSGPVFVYDYPASQAALARVRAGAPSVAERFELYIDGIEVANGYHEVIAMDELQACFERDRNKRRRLQLPDILPDQRLLAALDEGMPACSGVALGVDRLLMVLAKAAAIDEVLAFPVDIA